MRNSNDELPARAMHDPLGLSARARHASGVPPAETDSDDHAPSSVNPLWMITWGLAAFVVLLVAVW